jgi:hypothetical protein
MVDATPPLPDWQWQGSVVTERAVGDEIGANFYLSKVNLRLISGCTARPMVGCCFDE